jgi:hypothetical protein
MTWKQHTCCLRKYESPVICYVMESGNKDIWHCVYDCNQAVDSSGKVAEGSQQWTGTGRLCRRPSDRGYERVHGSLHTTSDTDLCLSFIFEVVTLFMWPDSHWSRSREVRRRGVQLCSLSSQGCASPTFATSTPTTETTNTNQKSR